MNSVALNGSRNIDEIFIDHRDKCGVVSNGEGLKDLIELANVIGPVIWGQSDSGKQHLDVRSLKSRNHLVEVVASLFDGQTAKPVVAAELDDYDFRIKAHNALHACDSVFRGCTAGALVFDFVTIAASDE